LIATADLAAQQLSSYIQKGGDAVESVTPAGSLRRGRETCGDLDLLVTLTPGKDKQEDIDKVSEHIVQYPGIHQVLARGGNKVSFLLESGGINMQVDVRLLEKKSFGAALMYFTGSKEHNVALRGRANDMGWTLNEYALTSLKNSRVIAGETEQQIYSKLKLAYIPPELRENTGEIEAAEQDKLPDLVMLEDIRGDLQMHTTASDGKHSIEAMAETARELGYEYIALTDHSKAVTVANGMDERRTVQQIKKIRAAEKEVGGIRLLASCEVDILKDGTLDLRDDVLAQLDIVVASVHSYMNMEKVPMTDRLLRAIENPYVDIVAHPTGRLILRREPYEYDMEKILEAAKIHGVAMEINSYPDRLDLKDTHARLAKSKGVKLVISTDSHSTGNLKYMKYGVITARRAWLEKRDVLNTQSLAGLLSSLRKRPGGAARAVSA
jgi:DNA polymerase (family 10)